MPSLSADKGVSRDDLLSALKEGIAAAKPEGAPELSVEQIDEMAEAIASGNPPPRPDGPQSGPGLRGFGTTVTGNCIYPSNPDAPLLLKLTAGNIVVTGNVLQNVAIEVDDQTEARKPIIIKDNILDNTSVVVKNGMMIREETVPQ